MKAVYQAIREQIQLECPDIKHVRLWNNQVQFNADGMQIEYLKPAVFIEFLSPINYTKLGCGLQKADDVVIRLHIVHEFYNGIEQEENLGVFDIKDDVYFALEEWKSETAKTGHMTRIAEELDTSHTNIYHFIQDYTINWIDDVSQRIKNGVTTSATIKVTGTINQ